MASATLTFSQLGTAPANHTGIQWAAGTTSTAPASASSVLNILQLPNQSVIVGGWLSVATGGDNNNIQLGTSNTPSGIMAITTLTSTYSLSVGTTEEVNIINKVINLPGGTTGSVSDLLPVKISLSDDVTTSTVWVQGRMAAAHSSSARITVTLFYSTDGRPGHKTIR